MSRDVSKDTEDMREADMPAASDDGLGGVSFGSANVNGSISPRNSWGTEEEVAEAGFEGDSMSGREWS